MCAAAWHSGACHAAGPAAAVVVVCMVHPSVYMPFEYTCVHMVVHMGAVHTKIATGSVCGYCSIVAMLLVCNADICTMPLVHARAGACMQLPCMDIWQYMSCHSHCVINWGLLTTKQACRALLQSPCRFSGLHAGLHARFCTCIGSYRWSVDTNRHPAIAPPEAVFLGWLIWVRNEMEMCWSPPPARWGRR